MFATQTSSFAQPETNDDFIYVAILRAKMIFRQIDFFFCCLHHPLRFLSLHPVCIEKSSAKLSESWKLKNRFLSRFSLAWVCCFCCQTLPSHFRFQWEMKNSIDFKVDSNGWWNNPEEEGIKDYGSIFMSSNNHWAFIPPSARASRAFFAFRAKLFLFLTRKKHNGEEKEKLF